MSKNTNIGIKSDKISTSLISSKQQKLILLILAVIVFTTPISADQVTGHLENFKSLTPNCSMENDVGFCIQKTCPFPLQFTHGLEVLDDNIHIALSSGWYGFSRMVIYKYDFDTCLFYQTFKEAMDQKYFAEGVTRIGNKLYQMTWRERRIVVWKIKGKYKNKLEHEISKTLPRFNRIQRGQGLAAWPVPNDETGKHLIWVSDNTTTLKQFDPVSWRHTKELNVSFPNVDKPEHIQELEIIRENDNSPKGISNFVFASGYEIPEINMIDLRTGLIVKTWRFDFLVEHQKEYVSAKLAFLREDFGEELTKIYDETIKLKMEKVQHEAFLQNFNQSDNHEHIYRHYKVWSDETNFLNGIAYSQNDDSFILTGALWDFIYKFKLDYHKYVTEEPIRPEDKAEGAKKDGEEVHDSASATENDHHSDL